MFNLYPGTVSPAFYVMLAEHYRTVDDMDMINFLLGDGQ